MVPANLIDFDLGLVGVFDFEGSGVNKADHVLLVSDSNTLTVRAPADVDVLSTGIDLVDTLSSYCFI